MATKKTPTDNDGQVLLTKGHRTRPFPGDVADMARQYGWSDPDSTTEDEPASGE